MYEARRHRYGSQQQNLPELRQKNEAAVYRLTALQMRHELEKGHRLFGADTGYGLWLEATGSRQESQADAYHSQQLRTWTGEISMTKFNHFNFNVLSLEKSVAFYKEALDLSPVREKEAADGSFKLVYLGDETGSDFQLELTWLRDRTEPYDLGECEFHLAFVTDQYDALYEKHKEMGCICFENPAMGIYFISDPDGYWVEIVPEKK
jgi:lactoylglutathione lyase